jgi:RNA polymerase sigma-70 factor (ECF subfamily)
VSPREDPAAPRPADPDQALVDRARRGDTDAFGELIRIHQHRVVNFTHAMVSNRADAEDVAQEAFLRAYRGLRQFRSGSAFKTWLYQIVVNAARTHLARRKNRPEDAAGDPAASPDAFGQPVSAGNVEAALIDRDRLDQALATLPDDLRAAVLLRDVEGLEYREIAVALDIPMGTVESRIFRGRARLRAAIREPVQGAASRGVMS